MPYTAAGKALMLNALKGTNPTTPITHVSLHSAVPGESGTNELSGGSPAYARKAVTFGSPSAGAMAATGQITFDIPPGATVSHVGYWSASTGGTFLGWADVTDETYGGQGTYTLTADTLDLNA